MVWRAVTPENGKINTKPTGIVYFSMVMAGGFKPTLAWEVASSDVCHCYDNASSIGNTKIVEFSIAR